MPIPVALIFRDNPGSLPAQNELAPALDMVFAATRVRINGAVAAAAFVPVFEVLASDGTIIAQARTERVFQVGDTGAVTYAPF